MLWKIISVITRYTRYYTENGLPPFKSSDPRGLHQIFWKCKCLQTYLPRACRINKRQNRRDIQRLYSRRYPRRRFISRKKAMLWPQPRRPSRIRKPLPLHQCEPYTRLQPADSIHCRGVAGSRDQREVLADDLGESNWDNCHVDMPGENGSYRYWNEEKGSSLQFGLLTVQTSTVLNYPNYQITTLIVVHNNGSMLIVHHFMYQNRPKHYLVLSGEMNFLNL